MNYLIDNLFPVINLVMLLFVLYRLQVIRRELDVRTARFERIDAELTSLKVALNGRH